MKTLAHGQCRWLGWLIRSLDGKDFIWGGEEVWRRHMWKGLGDRPRMRRFLSVINMHEGAHTRRGRGLKQPSNR